ncbi:MAG: HEPN domain-containing protein [candidate division KSB1 bacterium]|nr:HEPN domain-containing protein [candidate division KSB1 bacterium]
MSEQAAQAALKAFIIYHKKRYIWEHSIQELARLSAQYDKDFEALVEAGKILDRYYIPTRYPDAILRDSEIDLLISEAMTTSALCNDYLSSV